MNSRVSIDADRATKVGAQIGRARHDRAPNWFSALVAELWPVKGPAALAQYARCPDRTARAYSSGDREPPASVLRDLLRGDEGYRVLTHVMRDREPTWWVILQHERRLAALANQIFGQLGEAIHGVQAQA